MCCICEWKQLTAARAGSELLGAGTVQRLNVQRQASALTVQFSQFYIFPPLSQLFNLWFHRIITTRTPKTMLKVIFLSFSLQFFIFSRGNWKLQQLRREGNELPGARPHFSRFTCFLFSFSTFFLRFCLPLESEHCSSWSDGALTLEPHPPNKSPIHRRPDKLIIGGKSIKTEFLGRKDPTENPGLIIGGLVSS